MQEKRAYIRIGAPLALTYRLIGEESFSRKSIAKDFSEGNVRFPVYEEIGVGTPIEVHIETPFDTMPISAKGLVVWSKLLLEQENREAYELGIQFTDMRSFDQKRLAQAAQRFLEMGRRYLAA